MKDTSKFKACLHVTAKESLESILKQGLIPRVGPLSAQIGDPPAVWMFPYWECIEDANWLWDAWPYDSEPILLAVLTEGLDLMDEASYEVASFSIIEASRIRVLSDSELDWRKEDFLALGGLLKSVSG